MTARVSLPSLAVACALVAGITCSRPALAELPPAMDDVRALGHVEVLWQSGPFSGQVEDIALSSEFSTQGRVQRGAQTGDVVQMELRALELFGTSALIMGPVRLVAGQDMGLPPSQGLISDIRLDRNGDLRSGHGFFDVDIVIDLPSMATTLGGAPPIPIAGRLRAMPWENATLDNGRHPTACVPLSDPVTMTSACVLELGITLNPKGCCQFTFGCGTFDRKDCDDSNGTFSANATCSDTTAPPSCITTHR